MFTKEDSSESCFSSWLPSTPSSNDSFGDFLLARHSFHGFHPYSEGVDPDSEEERVPTFDSSISVTPSNTPPSTTPSTIPSRPASPAACFSIWQSYEAPETTSLISTSPMNSRRNSLEEEGGYQAEDKFHHQLHSFPPRHQRGRTIKGKSRQVATADYSHMPLKLEDVVYNEEDKDQKSEEEELKGRLSSLLPPLDGNLPIIATVINIQILQNIVQSFIRGTIILESRKASWRKHSKLNEIDVPAQSRQLPDLSTIALWDLPIEGHLLVDTTAVDSLTRSRKKTFEFPQYRIHATCKKCKQGYTDCARCDGLEPVACFWCNYTGYCKEEKCKKCNATGKINCVKCNNKTRVKCTSCDGKGAFKWALCVVLKVEPLSLPAIDFKDYNLKGEKEGNRKEAPSLFKLRATQAIFKTALRIFDNSMQGEKKKKKNLLANERRVPISAFCHVEKHEEKILHMTRWQQTQPNNIEHTFFNYTTTTNVDERKLKQVAEEDIVYRFA